MVAQKKLVHGHPNIFENLELIYYYQIAMPPIDNFFAIHFSVIGVTIQTENNTKKDNFINRLTKLFPL